MSEAHTSPGPVLLCSSRESIGKGHFQFVDPLQLSHTSPIAEISQSIPNNRDERTTGADSVTRLVQRGSAYLHPTVLDYGSPGTK